MRSERVFKKLRLFVASPSDVGAQRDRLNRVADRLNRTGGPADEAGVVLEVVRWESHVAPLMGRPQSVILEQVRADTWDLFVGILWLRFGSPPGAQSPDSGEDYGSGTEEEFDLAYKLWQESKRPHILMYRCIKPPERMDLVDADQWIRICHFFSRFSPQGPTPGLYSTFTEWSDFESRLEQDLTRLLYLMKNDGGTDTGTTFSNVNFDPNSLASRFRQGSSYQVAFISVDVVDHSKIVRKHKSNPSLTQTLVHNFFVLTTNIAARYEGHIFSWAGDGGTLIFEGERYRERTILAGLCLLNEIDLFNLDSEQNPLGDPISIRLAAHEGPILFQLPTSSMSSADLNLVVHLQEKFTSSLEFCITDTLLDNVQPRLSETFSFKGRFEGNPVFHFRPATREDKPTTTSLAALTEEGKDTARALTALLVSPAPLDRDSLETLSASLDRFYSSLQKLCTWFSTIDERWSEDYLKQVLRSTTNLIDQEAGIWEILRSRYVRQKRGAAEEHELEAIVQSNSSRRSRPVLLLERVRKEIGQRVAGDARTPRSNTRQEESLRSRIRGLMAADELEKEILLTGLLLNFKDSLTDYIVENVEEEECHSLRKHLWNSADLLLQDELFSLHSHRRKSDRKISRVLSDDPVRDPYFGAVSSLLRKPQVLSNQEIEDSFKASGCLTEEVNVEIAWKCLAIGHPDQDTQRCAVSHLSLSSVWQMIARNRIPRSLIYSMGMRFKSREAEELQKIFCDCTRASILEEIQRADDRSTIAELTKIILLLFEFEFMVETAYFERFDDLLTHFLQCVGKAGLKVDYFEKIRLQLDATRKERGVPSGDVPRNIRSMPLSIQRRLAGESPYMLWFIGHPDARVALETLRHINLSNVERVFKIPEANGELMRELLSRDEFFGRLSVVLGALSHPKCTVEFARRYLARVKSTGQAAKALSSIAQNSSANPVIRGMAKSMLTAQVH